MTSLTMLIIKNTSINKILHQISGSILLASTLLCLKTCHESKFIIGLWQNTQGIELKYNSFIGIILSINAFVNLLYSFSTTKSIQSQSNFAPFINLLLTGLNGLTLSNDAFNIYVFLELITISSCIIYAKQNISSLYKVIFDYLILASIASILFLISILILYTTTGSLNLDIISANLTQHKLTTSALILCIMAIILKLGLYPMHSISCDLYIKSENNKLTFLNSLIPQAYLILLLKIITALNADAHKLTTIIQIISIFGMIWLSLNMLFTQNIKKFLIMLSMSHGSYIVLCITLYKHTLIMQATCIAIPTYTVLKACTFSIVSHFKNVTTIQDLSIAISKYPIYKILTIIAILITSGLPISILFISKIFIITNMLSTTNIIIIALTIISFLISMIACLRFISTLGVYNKNNEHKANNATTKDVEHNLPQIGLITIALLIVSVSGFILPESIKQAFLLYIK